MGRREDIIAAEALALGFPLAGATPVGRFSRADFLESWLAEGRAGEMDWLERRTAERCDPRVAFPWAQAILAFAFPYRPPAPPPENWRATLRGRIAAYAVGIDYHERVRHGLTALIARLDGHFPGAQFRPYVDTGPLVEREWATAAGLGWIGKNTLTLHRDRGSYFFLAEVVTSLEVEAPPAPRDHCGTCTRCLTACPTGAFDAAYRMDPRRCLSYLTIEHRTAIPIALRSAMENWVFGCDVCQEVCPWNGDARDDDAAAFLHPALTDLVTLDVHGYRVRYGKTAVRRTKRRGLLRNAAVALGNSGNPDAIPALIRALDDHEPLVRGHAGWALGMLGGTAARAALERSMARETDPFAADELVAARARL